VLASARGLLQRAAASMRRLLDWGGTVVFLPVFVLVLLLFDVVQRIAKAFGKRAHDYAVACMTTSLVAAFRIVGLRLDVERAPEVAPHTSYLIISNHQSMFDIALLGYLFFTNFPKFVSKRELARWTPSVAFNLKYGGNCLIDRSDGEQAAGAIAALGRRVERNRVSAVIFPEGTRARAGVLGAFRPRGTLALLAAAPATAIVPVTIDESWRLMQWSFFPLPFGVRVRVRIDAPIAREAREDHARLLERVRMQIAGNLADMRGDVTAAARVA
jgi:1-acyl-sn-glycerol-3-phosphate acyltransferase